MAKNKTTTAVKVEAEEKNEKKTITIEEIASSSTGASETDIDKGKNKEDTGIEILFRGNCDKLRLVELVNLNMRSGVMMKPVNLLCVL